MSPRLHGNLLQDGGHWQPRLSYACLHEPGPAAIGGRSLGLWIVLEFLAKRQEKRLGEQNEAFAGPAIHLQ